MWKSIRKHVKLPKKLTNKAPAKKAPDEQAPDEQVPDEQVPDTGVPDTEVPDKGIPDKKVPDEQVPDEQVPDTGVPDKEVPDKGIPDKGIPDEQVPDEQVPDTGVPDKELSNKDRVRNKRFRRNGKRIKEVPRGSHQRGIHNIDDEITYVSNSDFVFHDSGGFEAGGVEELQAVWKFIRKRSLASPSQQLHAIWLCIPTDNDRPFGFLHSGFFSESTASVPVIGIFTKLDGRETKVMSTVLDSTASPSDFLDRVPEVKQKVAEFVHGLQTKFQKAQYPPAGFAGVGSMYTLSEE
ncbi:hypothetical protein BS47DRAFT_1353917 [Hydnum rufescens UP504]|uniref:Uncharacterized protein n=1 Tax=Hydnum rufescens UP504 TaxID=1448309 RepID=A0A9P6AGS1_9AGAM|nr:hypothetical protein BS47DRAFT_1353917 [Hydnum rufescens UP504]